MLSIEEAFGDPRSRVPAHDLMEMLVVALCTVVSEVNSWVAIQTWAEAKLHWLRRYLPLVNGIASNDTFGRVFAALTALLLKGAFVTIDTMGCQHCIAERIIQVQTNYVPAVKDNHPALAGWVRASLRRSCAGRRRTSVPSYEYRETEKDHSRIETRHCIAQDISSCWPRKVDGRWLGLRSVIMVEATCETAGVVSSERHYYISSLPANATRIAHAIRSHWRIENSMH